MKHFTQRDLAILDGNLSPDAPAETLWAEIFRLRAQVEGPEGFKTWQDAAVHERLQRVKAEKHALRYVAVRHFKDARDSSFDEDCDETVNSFLEHLKTIDPTALKILKNSIYSLQ